MNSYLPTQLIALETLARKEISRVLRIWKMTLAPPVLTTYLFYVVFGVVLGSRIGTLKGMAYMNFIIPGLFMNVVVLESFQNASSSLMIDKWNRVTDILISSPAKPMVLILSYIIGGLSRVLLASVGLLILFFVVSDITIKHPFILVIAVCMTSLFFSLFGLLSALYAKAFDQLSTMPTFILTPLSFFSGVFYDIKMLPQPWFVLSQFNPLVYLLRLYRFAFLDIQYANLAFHNGLLAFALIVFAFVIARLFRINWGLRL
ncbi:MAG: ABC transporter permease [Pseudomonadota bacterium]|nr:ABC transporter permease [Pseudomonadota bacterium]